MKHHLDLALALTGAAQSRPLKLHVPSPDWRDQIGYLVMTDRFTDGDAKNNDQCAASTTRRAATASTAAT